MNTASAPRGLKSIHHRSNNLLFVENCEEGVVIRAARDIFSEPRKLAFIHEMAAEGFIPDQFESLSNHFTAYVPGIAWVIDDSWTDIHFAVKRKTTRLMIRGLLASGAFWLVLMVLLLGGLL